MDLSDFIKITLISIRNGVVEANESVGKVYNLFPNRDSVNFDVAIEVARQNNTKKGGGISIKVVEGKLSDTAKSSESSYSRIKFSVGIVTNIK